MNERDFEPEHPLPRLGVDQLRAGLGEARERGGDVVDLVRDVMHAGAARSEELADRRVVAEGGQQLDAAVADPHRRRLDAVLVDTRAMLEPAAEQALVRLHRLVEVDDGDADVVDPAGLHGFDASRCVDDSVRQRSTAKGGGMRFISPAGLVAAVALLAGCGGGGSSSNGVASKSATDIVAAAKTAATGASAVHISGAIVSGGTPIALDLTIVRGKGGTGHMSENGVGFDIVRVGDKVYIRGTDAFYKAFAGAAVAALLHGKWLEGSATTGQLGESLRR